MLAGVLDCHAAYVSVLIEVNSRILVQILRLGDFACLELDVECVCVLEILYFQGGAQ